MSANVKFGFCEILGIFAAAALWHSMALAMVCISIAAIGAFFRVALDVHKEQKVEQARQDAAKILNDQVGEFGNVLKDAANMFGKKQQKSKKSSNGGFH